MAHRGWLARWVRAGIVVGCGLAAVVALVPPAPVGAGPGAPPPPPPPPLPQPQPQPRRALSPDVVPVRLAGEQADALARRAAAGMSAAVAEVLGPPAGGAWFAPGDIALYALASPGDPTDRVVLAVPAAAVVRPDGTVAFPDAAGRGPRAASGGIGGRRHAFSGPWGGERLDVMTLYAVDHGGFWCNTTRGELRMRVLRRRLRDASRRFDYVGVSLDAVAEITDGADNCNDTLDWFDVSMRADNPRGVVLDQAPIAGHDGRCRIQPITVGVQAPVGGGVAFATLTDTIEQCERWHVVGALADPPSATTPYGVEYDHTGIDAHQRSAALMSIIRLPQGRRLHPVYRLALDVDNVR